MSLDVFDGARRFRRARNHRMQLIHVAACGHIILSAVELKHGTCDLCDPMCKQPPVEMRVLYYQVPNAEEPK